jgi:hypothetical protein
MEHDSQTINLDQKKKLDKKGALTELKQLQ